jgi:hypothetical protein
MLPLLMAGIGLCAPLHGDEMINGSAIVTSRSGQIKAISSEGQHLGADLHDVLTPTGLRLSTGAKSRFFLTLSNGVAFALDASSSLHFEQYTQRPFTLEEQTLGLEPSVSHLKVHFESGQIAIASNRFSPLSELRVQLPIGELRLHKGTCLIRYEEATGLQITALDGNLTYYYPEGSERAFIAAPKGVRISRQSAARNQIAETFTADTLPKDASHLSQAAQHASKRVTFEANIDSRMPPKPILIVPPDILHKPPLRSYSFND